MIDERIERICLAIADLHGCHTTILYGSRARGVATADSDVDIACVREDGPPFRDARRIDGIYYDAFVYPESAVREPKPALVRIYPGIVLRERGGIGTALLASLEEIYRRGPAPLSEEERTFRVLWAHKTLARVRGSAGLDASYRRSLLVVAALEDYFALRGKWFRGAKEAFAGLDAEDARIHRAFIRATQSAAADDALAELVAAVYGRETESALVAPVR